jgi:hypothetical protein
MLISRLAAAVGLSLLSSCSTVQMTQSGALSSYTNLNAGRRPADAKTFVDKSALSAIRTVAILPTSIGPQASPAKASHADLVLVANAVDRAMCLALAEKFQLVRSRDAADLTVGATITTLVPTGKTAAGISRLSTLGSSIVLPVGIPRLPIGLGGLAVEFEALSPNGVQRAAMTWARGANSITNAARVSEIGDAYGLASGAGRRFGRMIVLSDENPGISLPSAEQLATSMGRRSTSDVCNDFGRPTGLAGLAGRTLGAPPSWSDTGPIRSRQ